MKNIYIDSKKKTVNDTGKYALQINYVFGLFDTLETARTVYDDVMSKWDSIDDSPYGLIGILPPNYRDPDLPNLGIKEDQPLSKLQAINIADYAFKHPARRDVRLGFKGGDIDKLAGKSSLPIRLDRYKSAKKHDKNAVLTESFWDDLVITKWTLEAEQQQWLKAVPTANLDNYRFESRFDFFDEWNSKFLPHPRLP
ncbi:hypothetical protein P5U49_000244 [Neisseria gonorrhoeae]